MPVTRPTMEEGVGGNVMPMLHPAPLKRRQLKQLSVKQMRTAKSKQHQSAEHTKPVRVMPKSVLLLAMLKKHAVPNSRSVVKSSRSPALLPSSLPQLPLPSPFPMPCEIEIPRQISCYWSCFILIQTLNLKLNTCTHAQTHHLFNYYIYNLYIIYIF